MKSRTDLAFEEVETLEEEGSFQSERKTYQGIGWQHLRILKKNNLLEKEPGDYITIEITRLNDQQERQHAAAVVEEAILQLLPEKNHRVLVVGLGNQEVTADSLGPKVAEEIVVTSHLFRLQQDADLEGCRDVAVLIPRVMGQTGIETALLVKAVTQQLQPDLVIAIDALATRSLERINRVIQITNTGIRPGSGVGNHRLAIDQANLGVPVIAVGVATVVSVEALIFQVLEAIDSHETQKAEDFIQNRTHFQMVVTPKEMDEEVLHLEKILAQGINEALHPRFSEL